MAADFPPPVDNREYNQSDSASEHEHRQPDRGVDEVVVDSHGNVAEGAYDIWHGAVSAVVKCRVLDHTEAVEQENSDYRNGTSGHESDCYYSQTSFHGAVA